MPGFYFIVFDVLFGAGEHVYVAENTGKTPLILILEIRACAPFENKHVKFVFSVNQVIGYVELAYAVTYLAETDEFTV